jgi:hypothetical protein
MKLFIFSVIFLAYVLIAESLPSGLTFLACPDGGSSIDCSKVKCCPSDKRVCCLDESSLKDAIPVACGSIYPEGHPMGCCGQKLCSEK